MNRRCRGRKVSKSAPLPRKRTPSAPKHSLLSALRESEQRFKALAAATFEGVVIIQGGRFVDANNQFLQMVGFTRKQLVGLEVSNIVPSEDRQRVLKTVVKDREARIEHALIRKDGSRILVEAHGRTLRYRNRKLRFTAIRDITERKKAEEALRQVRVQLERSVQERTAELKQTLEALAAERQRFINVLDSLPVYVALLSPDYHVPFANRVFRHRFGEVHGRRCYEHLFNRTEPCEICDTYKVLETGAPHQWEWTGPDQRDYSIFDFPFTDSDGSRLILEMGIDVTERKRAEAELEKHRLNLEELVQARTAQLESANSKLQSEIIERYQTQEALKLSEEELAAIYDHAPLIMMVMDGERRVRKVNRFGEGFVNGSTDGILGRRAGNALGCLHAWDAPEGCGFGPLCHDCTVRRTIQETYDTGVSHQQLEVSQTLIVEGVNQELTFLLSTARVELRGKREVLVTLQNITARKRAEQALREAQAKLAAHAEELEKTVARRTTKLHDTIGELEQFSYAITHDMRAPLRAMQGFADLIEEECAGCVRNTAQQYFRRIRAASTRMDQLIQDSLNYSKAVRDEIPTEPVDLGELLAGLLETYPNLQPEKADIQLAGELPTVLGSAAALTQCFSNLLGNAVKFVTLGVHPRVRVWAEVDGAASAMVRIWIQDNGIGVPKNQHQRIFGMFQRATKDYEGTGVGLAIVQKVVQRMGGQVGVESEEGKGSRFWLLLRRAT